MPGIHKIFTGNLPQDIYYNRLKALEKAKGGSTALELVYKIGLLRNPINIEEFSLSLLEKHEIYVVKNENERVYYLEDQDFIRNCLERVKDGIKVSFPNLREERLASARRVLVFE